MKAMCREPRCLWLVCVLYLVWCCALSAADSEVRHYGAAAGLKPDLMAPMAGWGADGLSDPEPVRMGTPQEPTGGVRVKSGLLAAAEVVRSCSDVGCGLVRDAFVRQKGVLAPDAVVEWPSVQDAAEATMSSFFGTKSYMNGFQEGVAWAKGEVNRGNLRDIWWVVLYPYMNSTKCLHLGGDYYEILWREAWSEPHGGMRQWFEYTLVAWPYALAQGAYYEGVREGRRLAAAAVARCYPPPPLYMALKRTDASREAIMHELVTSRSRTALRGDPGVFETPIAGMRVKVNVTRNPNMTAQETRAERWRLHVLFEDTEVLEVERDAVQIVWDLHRGLAYVLTPKKDVVGVAIAFRKPLFRISLTEEEQSRL